MPVRVPVLTLLLGLVVAGCTIHIGPKGTRALSEPVAVGADDAVVVAGFRVRHPYGVKSASAFWAPIDPRTGQFTGGTAQSLQMTTRDCPDDAGDGCGQATFHYGVYKVPPGTYILNFMNSFRRSGFGISEVTHFTPRNRYDDGQPTSVGAAVRSSPVFTVKAGETVYIGNFLFVADFASTETNVQMVYIYGVPQVGTVTNYATYDYRLYRVSFDKAAADAAAHDVLQPTPRLTLRRLDNADALGDVVR